VLIVSTDPASNLDEVLGVGLTQSPTAIPGAPGLFALNIDPEAAAQAYREGMVAPYRGILPAAAIQSMEEQFSGACTVEIAAFDAFSKLLGDPAATAGFDHVIFDTAPTGHTLRLLTLPSAWDEFISSSTGGASCLGPLAGLEKQKALYAATVARLSSPGETTIILVARADTASLREANRTRLELTDLGIHNQMLVINGLFCGDTAGDAIAGAMAARAAAAIAAMPAELAGLAQTRIPSCHAARWVWMPCARWHTRKQSRRQAARSCRKPPCHPAAWSGRRYRCHRAWSHHDHGQGWRRQNHGGGSHCSCAGQGHKVVLSTTDPAAHTARPLMVSCPDFGDTHRPRAGSEAIHHRGAGQGGQHLDAGGRAMLEEDLRSPCTKKSPFSAPSPARWMKARTVSWCWIPRQPGIPFSCLTLPRPTTGKSCGQGDMPEAVRQLLPRLRDPGYTRVLIVTLPKPPRCMRPNALAPTWRGPVSRRMPGSSTSRCWPAEPGIRLCQRGACDLSSVALLTRWPSNQH
jgi:arsenite-transporting ATPase